MSPRKPRPHFAFAVALGVVCLSSSQAGAQTPGNPRANQVRASQLQLRAEDLQAQGKFAEAAAALQQAAELTPEDWILWDQAGWAHLDNTQAAPALKAFENARKAAPPGTPLYGGVMVAHFALGNQKEVLDLVRQAAPPALVERAVAIVTKGLAAKPRTSDWNFALGYLYARVLGNSPRGLGLMEAVVAQVPAHAEAWLILVEINQALNRGAKEDAAAVKYLELAPETVDAYRLRAQRFTELRRFTDAVTEYNAGIAKYPLESELYYGLARVHERAGGVKAAEETYRKLADTAGAQKLEALQLQARAQLAGFQTRQKNYVEAEKYYREAAQRPDAAAVAWNNWASLLVLNGKWAEAAGALEKAAALREKERGGQDPARGEEVLTDRYRAAVCRLAAGQRIEAKKGLDAACVAAPTTRTSPAMELAAFLTWTEGRQAKGERLAYQHSDERWARFTWRREPEEGEFEALGRYSAAATAWRAILQQLQKLYPDCWPADYALARIYAAAGYTTDALTLLTKASRGTPEWWAVHYAVGEYHARERHRDKGIEALTRVLRLAPENRQARVYLSLLNGLKDE